MTANMAVLFFFKSDAVIKSYDAKREKITTIMIDPPKENLIIESISALLGVSYNQSCYCGSLC